MSYTERHDAEEMIDSRQERSNFLYWILFWTRPTTIKLVCKSASFVSLHTEGVRGAREVSELAAERLSLEYKLWEASDHWEDWQTQIHTSSSY